MLSLPAHAVETMRVQMGPVVQTAIIDGAQLSVGEDAEDARFSAVGKKQTVTKGTLGGVVRFRSGDALSVNGMSVRGDVVAVPQAGGVLLVNVIPLEDYLVGVLGSEMPRSFPPEALKAQAIAARTYALQKKLEQYGQPYHLGSSVISQVYGGLKAEDPRTREAVEATRGLVLTYDLQPIEAYFHSSCGGKTESGLQALGRELAYLKPVACPCGKLPTSKWSMAVSSDDLKAAFGTKPSDLRIEARTATGRATRVALGPTRSVDAVTFRERLGYGKLKSLQFQLAPSSSGWAITGTGFGHGAGLCQWGAKVLADQGKDFKQILAHYYPGTELQLLY